MSVKKDGRLMIGMGVLALMALALGFFVYQHQIMTKVVNKNQFQGTFLDKPRSIRSFELMGTDNLVFNHRSLEKHWTFMFFGFTSCGSVCPTTMAELNKMYHILETNGTKPLPQVVMVSLDPERDSLKTLQHYVQAFNPNFYGARGDEEVIHSMTRELGIAYAKIAEQGSGVSRSYDIEHTGTVILFDPAGKLVAFFTTPHQAGLLAKDYQLEISQFTHTLRR